MQKHKLAVLIDHARCSPCSTLICVDVCPFGVLEVGTDGKPHILDVTCCTQCGVCATLCPTKAITVTPNSSKTNEQ